MKALMRISLATVLCIPLLAQTESLGLSSFANEQTPIMMAVDAAFAARNLDNPYLMFVLYMAAKNQRQEITVGRDDVTIVFQGKEFKMPSVKELRSNYNGQIRDLDFYGHLGREGIHSSWTKFYSFWAGTEFFPPNAIDAPPASDYGTMFNTVGFATSIYFKNPGFKKGDTFLLKVRDKDNPDLNGEVTVVLK